MTKKDDQERYAEEDTLLASFLGVECSRAAFFGCIRYIGQQLRFVPRPLRFPGRPSARVKTLARLHASGRP